jgi:hypothetical protein
VAIIEDLCLKPILLSRIKVLLCQMMVMPLMRSTLFSNLEEDFILGYCDKAVVLYDFTTNKEGLVDEVMEEDMVQ